jgi:GLPGLI family protein
MKTRFYIAFVWLSGMLMSLAANSQKRLTEATISYDIVINTDNSTPQAADLLDGATSVIYLKGNSSRSEMISSLGTQATNLTPDNWKESNKKYDGIGFQYFDEYKMIAGYNCQKAVGTLSDGTSFTVYFTKDLAPVNKDFQYLNRNLPGLAMQYEGSLGKLMVTYTVANINFNPVPQAKFDLPRSGYRVMTYEESKQAAKR